MPGGGSWTTQNKQRPGAYINFVSVAKPNSVLGNRGTMTAALPMDWGPSGKLIELTSDELLNGGSFVKIGYDVSDIEQSLPYRLALAGCYRALLYRADTGGTKATAVVGTAFLTISAKYAGVVGNSIVVVIKTDTPATGSFTIQVLYRQKLQEEFVVTKAPEIADIESNWVDFTLDESVTDATEIPATAGATLAGGTNGELTSDFSEYLNLITTAQWQCMTILSSDSSIPALVNSKIQTLRMTAGKKVQAVLSTNQFDTEGVIAVKQGFRTNADVVTTTLFPLWAASITAGAAVNQSNTARVVTDALEIINPIDEEDIGDELKQGWFLLSYRQDGAVVVEQDINSLHTFTADKDYPFCKNRVIRCLDEIGNNVSLIFNTNYSGKVDNDDLGRNTYKTELISYLDSLQGIGAIRNFMGSDDLTILPGEGLNDVVVDLTIQPVDSMEKLYMTVNVNS